MKRTRQGFTLIELLIVIAIIAILSVVVILTLNPAELLKQSRDSNRVSDMEVLTSALGIYSASGGTSLGSPNKVYVSIPDPTATSTAGDQCQGLGLISLPATYSYQCAASSTYRNVNGTGWIPVNFSSMTAGSPLSQLPVDPTNQSSSRLYYAYATNGTQYEVTAGMESSKYKLGGSGDVVSTDGGVLTTVYEKGSALGLQPMDYGDPSLVGYWSFNEGTGSIAYDYSGSNATGTWNGTQAGTSGYYSPGKIGPWAGTFDGSTDYINVGDPTALNFSGPVTMSAWVYPTVSNVYQGIIVKGGNSRDYSFFLSSSGTGTIYVSLAGGGSPGAVTLSPGWTVNAWNYIAVTADGTNVRVYINGVLAGTTASSLMASPSANSVNLGTQVGLSNPLHGLMDDARVYDRALSASEIAAIYTGGK